MVTVFDHVYDSYHFINKHVRQLETCADYLLAPLHAWNLAHQYEVLIIDNEYLMEKSESWQSKAVLIVSIVFLPLSLISVTLGALTKVILQEASREMKQKYSFPLKGSPADPYIINNLRPGDQVIETLRLSLT